MKTNRCFLALPALLFSIACSDDDGGGGAANGDGGSSADSGPSAGGSAGMSTGGSGGMSGGGSGGASGSSTDGGAVVRTSESCGNIPILGDYVGSLTPVECATCVETSCCEEAAACGDHAGCLAYRECAAGCGSFDYRCRNECAFANSSGGLNGPFNQCRSVNCAACTDLSCVDEPFPAPTQATYSATIFVYNLATSTGIAGVNVKVCDRADVDCAAPLEEQTTDAAGNVTVTLPSAPKGTTAYLELTGAGIIPQLSFPSNREPETALSAALLTLDGATGAAFLQLAGGTLPPDGGINPDGGIAPLGSLGVQAYSCGGASLAGVTFESSNAGPDADTAYMSGGVPSPTATATDGSGQGAIVDHQPGLTTVSMLSASGQTLGSMDVLVREGFFTTVTIPVGP